MKLLLIVFSITLCSCIKKNELWGTWQQTKPGCAFTRKEALNLTLSQKGLYYISSKENDGPIYGQGEWDTNFFGDLVFRETLASFHSSTHIEEVYHLYINKNLNEISLKYRNGYRFNSNTKKLEFVEKPHLACKFTKQDSSLLNQLNLRPQYFSSEPEQRSFYISLADAAFFSNYVFITLHFVVLIFLINVLFKKIMGKKIVLSKLRTFLLYVGLFLILAGYLLKLFLVL